MHLVEIYLPIGGAALEAELAKLRVVLTEKFGGFTAHTHSPAQGAWRAPQTGQVEHDDLIVVEVMTHHIDRAWWAKLREDLERALRQEDILIRTHQVEVL